MISNPHFRRAEAFVSSSKTCCSHPRPASSLLQPLCVTVTKTRCLDCLISRTHASRTLPLSLAMIRLGGRATPEALTHAISVTHYLLPSSRAWRKRLLPQLVLLKTRFCLPILPIMKPFSSILYVCSGCMFFSAILSSSMSKYKLYLL
jgi:hypothetical protein